MITFVFPRWLFPNNLGDSILATVIPRLLFKKYGEKVDVITYGDDYMEFYRADPCVDSVKFTPYHLPAQDWINISTNPNRNGLFQTWSVYPEWHPEVFSYWKDHPELVDHPTVNLVMVNYLLQLGLTKYLWDGTDLKPDFVNNAPYYRYNVVNEFRLGIIPATKLGGRGPGGQHPGCNGRGLRYKLEHWETFVNHIQKHEPDVKIGCFSETDLGLGQWLPPSENLQRLAVQAASTDLGVCSDGGMHHMFHACGVPTVLFTGTLVNKAEFFKTALDFYPEHLHLPCRQQCRSYFTEVFGGEDKSKTCKLECENLDPIGLAEYTLEQIKIIRTFKVDINKINTIE